jgi:hypothetical protein
MLQRLQTTKKPDHTKFIDSGDIERLPGAERSSGHRLHSLQRFIATRL